MNQDPATDDDDIAQEIELARAMGKLRVGSQAIANHKRIDVARRRSTQLRASRAIWMSRTAPPDPATIVAERDLVEVIETVAAGWPFGPEFVACMRDGMTVRQAATTIGLQKSQTGKLIAAFRHRVKHIALGELK